jgi:putative addiction module killer protein
MGMQEMSGRSVKASANCGSTMDRASVYFQKRGNTLIILLCGGNKSTQAKDIQTAKRLAADWSEEDG